MTGFVVDASVAVKWVVTEPGTPEAVRLLKASPLHAPDLLTSECANILWKKVQRQELIPAEALLSARLLQRADIELHPTRHLLDFATQMAIELNHPAYDCVYLSLAATNGWQVVTADEHLVRKVRAAAQPAYVPLILSVSEAVRTFFGSA